MNNLTEEQKDTIKKLISESSDYLVRSYIDELTKAISDVWSVADVLDYCENHAGIECSEQQAWEALLMMRENYDINWGYTWNGMVHAVDEIVGNFDRFVRGRYEN